MTGVAPRGTDLLPARPVASLAGSALLAGTSGPRPTEVERAR